MLEVDVAGEGPHSQATDLGILTDVGESGNTIDVDQDRRIGKP